MFHGKQGKTEGIFWERANDKRCSWTYPGKRKLLLKKGMKMRYAALFRGLNVGGRHRVEMAALRAMLSALGLEQVSTYIQSGNALFSTHQEEPFLRLEIAKAFGDTFGFESPVILRNSGEMEALVKGVPFSPRELAQAREAAAGAESLYCYLLEAPLAAGQAGVIPQRDAEDQLVIAGQEIYLLCHQSIRSSKLAASLEKLSVPMTCRNLKTLEKLLELLQ